MKFEEQSCCRCGVVLNLSVMDILRRASKQMSFTHNYCNTLKFKKEPAAVPGINKP